MKILLAERVSSRLVCLQRAGHTVERTPIGATPTDVPFDSHYDLVILDAALLTPPQLREARMLGLEAACLVLLDSPVRGNTESCAVSWLNAGADDAVAADIDTDELIARTHALLRRGATPPVEVIEVDGIRLDRTARTAEKDECPLPLTAREFSLLELLMINAGRVLSRSTLAERCWDHAYSANSNVIDVLIGRIRRKLSRVGSGAALRTVRGAGYVLGQVSEG